MKKLNSEWRFVLSITIIVAAFLLLRGAFLRHEEESVETSYEAGYTAAMEDVVNMSTVIETKEVDGDMHILIKLPNGDLHEYISPAAKG